MVTVLSIFFNFICYFARYLIVIDNILDEPEWELLKCALIDNSHGSVALLTSRKSHHIAHFVGKIYTLAKLSVTDSKKCST